MYQRRIRLKTVDDVQDFVKAADKCSFDVNLISNETLIDAKSIMGVMSMDLTQVLVVACREKDPALEQVLDRLTV